MAHIIKDRRGGFRKFCILPFFLMEFYHQTIKQIWVLSYNLRVNSEEVEAVELGHLKHLLPSSLQHIDQRIINKGS